MEARLLIDMVDKKDYDFIFLDIKMPDVNGFEVLDYVKTELPTLNGGHDYRLWID